MVSLMGWGCMKLNRWLDDAQFRPGRTLAVNVFVYAVAQSITWGVLAYAIATKKMDIWAVFCFNIALPPIFIWATYNSVRRAWLNQPREDLDEAVPALVVWGICALLWLWIGMISP